MTAPIRTYQFDRTFQLKLLAMLCRVKGFLKKHRPLIRASYFEDPVMQDTCRVILDYYEKYGDAPTVNSVAEALKDMVQGDKRRQKLVQEYEAITERLRNATFEEEQDIADRVKDFARRSAVEAAFYECVEDFKNGATTGFADRIMEAEKLSMVLDDPGISFFEDTNWIEWSRVGSTMPTGLQKMDRLLGGGLAKKELG